MALRIQLISQSVGSLLIDHADPIGINEINQTIKRSADNDGVIFQMVLDLAFIKQGRRLLKQAWETDGGPDAIVLVNTFLWDPNQRRFNIYNQGKVNFQKYSVEEDKVTVNIDQIGFQTNVLNLLETDVDLETLVAIDGVTHLPATKVLDLPYHSKKIIKQTKSTPNDSNENQFLDVFEMTIPNSLGGGHVGRDGLCIGTLDTSTTTVDELNDSFQIQYAVSNANGNFNDANAKDVAAYIVQLNAVKDNRFEIYRAVEAGVLDATIHSNLRHNVTVDNLDGDVDICGSGALGFVEIKYWFEVRDKNNNILLLECMHEAALQACGTEELGYDAFSYTKTGVSIQIGHKVYAYQTIRVYGNYDQPTGFLDGHLHHNFILQNAPSQWIVDNTYGLGDVVLHAGHKWHSDIADNLGLVPGVSTHWIDDGVWSGDQISSFISLSSATIAPVTTARTILLHDAIKKACQFVTGQIDCFESTLLGRTDLGYAVDGDGGLIGWTNGGCLRKLANKKIFGNLKEMIAFTNSVFCTSFGFEFVDGRWILRLERKNYFFNKNLSSVSLGKVYRIKGDSDPKRFYNLIEYGYEGKLEIGQVNAIDEFNSLRRDSIPISNTKNTLKISTTVRASGYQIEAQRRLQFSTVDTKLDEDKFVVVVIRDSTVAAGFRSKQNEGYAEILNVFDPSTGYNYDISPARCLMNWYEFLAGVLIRSKSKKLTFVYGEINYRMITRKTTEAQQLSEQGNPNISTIQPLYEPFNYSFQNVKFTREQWRLLAANPYGIIDFEDRFGETFEGFLNDTGVDHDSTKGIADFNLLKVYRP